MARPVAAERKKPLYHTVKQSTRRLPEASTGLAEDHVMKRENSQGYPALAASLKYLGHEHDVRKVPPEQELIRV
jgi:hypothetical protein